MYKYILLLKKNDFSLIILLLLILFNSSKSKIKETNDVFLSLENGFNCKNINNIVFNIINTQNEKEIFQSKAPFILYITSNWCDYCCQESKILSQVQKYLINSKNSEINKIKIYQIQSDEYINIIKKYKIFLTKIPSLYLVKNNQNIIQYSSYYKKKDIIHFIKKNIFPFQVLNTYEEALHLLNDDTIKIKLIGFFPDKKEYNDEYKEFIKYSKDINYRKDVEIKTCFDKNITMYLKHNFNFNEEKKILDEYSMNILVLKRYDKIYSLDISLKGKYIKDFIYYNTFSPVEEISDNNKKIIMQLKTPIALFFIDTTYNINNYHKVLNYLEELSYNYEFKYIFTIMDGGTISDFKQKLGLDNNFPSLIIHYFDKRKSIKFNFTEQKFTDDNIRKFLNNNLIINNEIKIDISKNIKNNEILKELKSCKLLEKEKYNDILFNQYKNGDLLLFIIDEYSFDIKEIQFSNKIKSIINIIEKYGINFYIEKISWISKHDLIEYKKNKNLNINDNNFNKRIINYLLNAKIILKNNKFSKEELFMKEYKYEKENINEDKFIYWLKDNCINKFEIPKNDNYYEELYYKYQKKNK